jgi:hypothetical protein
MDKSQLIEKVKLMSHLPQPDRDKILGWANALPNTSSKVTPNEFKVGDVFMHPVFVHPYILLEKHKEHWVCGMLTSEADCAEILEPCQSRFFNNNFFTKILFTVKEPVGSFMSIYENKSHMLKVYKTLKQIFN